MRDEAVEPLPSKAFDTLLALVRHVGTEVGKDALLRPVWPDEIVEESNLTQTVFMLRRALDDSVGDHRFIVTVPKRGYCFVAEVQERRRQPICRQGLTRRRASSSAGDSPRTARRISCI